MYGAIGFCAAWLMALMCFPAVHHRAQRLLRKHYEQTPLSVQEMRAERDQIRAGFAVATRDLELSIEKLKEKTAAHATEIVRKTQLVERLKVEFDALNQALGQSIERERSARDELSELRKEFDAIHTTLSDFTAREREMRATLLQSQRELVLKDNALDTAEREICAIKAEIARLAPLLQPRSESSARQGQGDVLSIPTKAPPSLPTEGILHAFAEIDAAARRVEQRGTSFPKTLTNQHLRAVYAPVLKPAN